MTGLIREYFRINPARAVLSITLNTAAGALSVLFLFLLKDFIRGSASLPYWTLLAVGALAFAAGAVGLYISMQLGNDTLNRLRKGYVHVVMTAPEAALQEYEPHERYAVVREDIDSVHEGVQLVPQLINSGFIFLFGLMYLLTISAGMFFVALAITVSSGALIVMMSRNLRRHARLLRQHLDSIYYYIQGSVFSAREVRQHPMGYSGWLHPRLSHEIDLQRRTSARVDWLWSATRNASTLVILILIVAVALVGQELGYESGLIASCIIVILFLRSSAHVVLGAAPALSAASISLANLNAFVAKGESWPSESSLEPHATRRKSERIEFERVAFQYPVRTDDFCLRPLSFSLERGKVVFVSGGNGTGKSTLVNIASGVYAPTGGRILSDGEAIGTRELRRACACVYQRFDPFVPPLDAGGAPVDLSRFGDYLEAFGLELLLRVPPRKWTAALSGGQIKRLGILSAVLDGRAFVIMDEPAAEQDTAFRSLFYECIVPELRRAGRGIMLVSHDIEHLGLADLHVRLYRGEPAHVEPRPDRRLADVPQ